MQSNMTFRMDADIKREMSEICRQLGMTTSTAFNIFAGAFVRAKGMPFQVALTQPVSEITAKQMADDANSIMEQFTEDYRRMAE